MMATLETRLIDAGFSAFANAQGPLPPDLAVDLRIAFFAGAQHMFESIVRMSRGQQPPVTKEAIEAEFQHFIGECRLRCVPAAGNA